MNVFKEEKTTPSSIHPTVIIEDNVRIEDAVHIGPYSIIREGVSIGYGTHIGSHVEIASRTRIGQHNSIGTGCILGETPQIKPQDNRTPFHLLYPLEIGHFNVLREYVTVHRGSKQMTCIESHNYLMTQVHVAHDCHIKNHVTMANGATLGGFVTVQDNAFISAHAHVHQNVSIGKLAMVGSLSFVSQDILPFALVSRDNTRIYGINQVGLKRMGYSDATIQQIKKLFNLIFDKSLLLEQRITQLKRIKDESRFDELSEELESILHVLQSSNRGFLYPSK